jgi:hypothetical protein
MRSETVFSTYFGLIGKEVFNIISGGIREFCGKAQYIILIQTSHKLDGIIERNLEKMDMISKCLKFRLHLTALSLNSVSSRSCIKAEQMRMIIEHVTIVIMQRRATETVERSILFLFICLFSSIVLVNLFIYSFFNGAFSSSDYVASNERMIVNNELERTWKEAVVA